MHRTTTASFGALAVLAAAFLVLVGNASAAELEYPPDFACSDTSFKDFQAKGSLTLGIAPDAPYTFVDAETKLPGGIDWEIHKAALEALGIKDVKYEIMPFESLIPSLLSGRIDVIADNIHPNPKRHEVIDFTSPAWWYGPGVIVQEGNPAGIKSWDDLTRPDVSVGLIAGSAGDEYLKSKGVKTQFFQDGTSLYASLEQGRITAVFGDDVQFGQFKAANAAAKLELLDVPAAADYIASYGSYTRYAVRKADCTLNFAYSRALSELRDDGTILAILNNWGLGVRNLLIPGVLN